MKSQPGEAPLAESRLLEEKRVVRATGLIALATLISRILGFARDMVLARLFGASMVADAFYVAFRIPSLLRELFAEGSMSAAFIPVFTEYLTRRTREETRELARASMITLFLILLTVVGIGILVAPWIVRLIAPGFWSTPGKFYLTVSLTQIMFPYLLLVSLSAWAMGILNSHRRFGAPASSPAVFNVAMILVILTAAPFYSEPIMAAALGVTVGGLFQLLYQLPAMAKTGMIPSLSEWVRPLWPLHPGVRQMGALILPTLLGLSVAQVNILINTLIASFLSEGSVSYLYYGMRLIHFPLGVFGVALATALLPTLSAQAARNATEELRHTLSFGVRLIFFITVPAMIGLILLRRPIIHLLFQHGEFGPLDTAGTATAVLYYAVGLWAFAAVRVVVPAFYSMKDTRTPVKVGVLAMGANIVLNLLLMIPLQHGGLALATSLASMLNLTLLLGILRRRIGRIDGRRIFRSLFNTLLASAAVALPSLWIAQLSLWGEAGQWPAKAWVLSAGIGISVAGYLTVQALLKAEELRYLAGFLKEKVGR